jgi:hypothetical protein
MGSLAAGWISEHLSARLTLLGGASITGIAALSFLRRSKRRRLALFATPETPAAGG